MRFRKNMPVLLYQNQYRHRVQTYRIVLYPMVLYCDRARERRKQNEKKMNERMNECMNLLA